MLSNVFEFIALAADGFSVCFLIYMGAACTSTMAAGRSFTACEFFAFLLFYDIIKMILRPTDLQCNRRGGSHALVEPF